MSVVTSTACLMNVNPTSQPMFYQEDGMRPVDVEVVFDERIRPAEEIVGQLTAIPGRLFVYCWFEGTNGLPELGARFMSDRLFFPLLQRKQGEVLMQLYFLYAWKFDKPLCRMAGVSPLQKKVVQWIQERNMPYRCLSSVDFFRFAVQMRPESAMYRTLSSILRQKEELRRLSLARPAKGMTVGQFLGPDSLFSFLSEEDVAQSYSFMQYCEAYYQVRVLVEETLQKIEGNERDKAEPLQIVFLLPNDEGQYYRDFPREAAHFLSLDFGTRMEGLKVRIFFSFFRYGEALSARPYNGDSRGQVPKNQVVRFLPTGT